MSVHEFSLLMRDVARANNDEFDVTFTYHYESQRWEVLVAESTEQHTLIGGRGKTPDEAAADALKAMPRALKAWGYKMPTKTNGGS